MNPFILAFCVSSTYLLLLVLKVIWNIQLRHTWRRIFKK